MKIISFGVMAAVLFVSNSITPPVYASEQKLNLNTKSFSVKLGATRVIYHAGTAGATLSVSNPQNYPILVQSSVKAADKSSPAPFGDAASISFRSEPAESTAYCPYWW